MLPLLLPISGIGEGIAEVNDLSISVVSPFLVPFLLPFVPKVDILYDSAAPRIGPIPQPVLKESVKLFEVAMVHDTNA